MQSIEEQIVAALGPVFTDNGDGPHAEDADFAHVGPFAKSKFGAFVWPTLKALMSSLPDEYPLPHDTRTSIVVMLTLIGGRLPCPECRSHFLQRIKHVYPHTVSRASILKWICDVENQVRVENGKTPFSREEILQYLHSMAHKSAPPRLPAHATPIHGPPPSRPHNALLLIALSVLSTLIFALVAHKIYTYITIQKR